MCIVERREYKECVQFTTKKKRMCTVSCHDAFNIANVFFLIVRGILGLATYFLIHSFQYFIYD